MQGSGWGWHHDSCRVPHHCGAAKQPCGTGPVLLVLVTLLIRVTRTDTARSQDTDVFFGA